MAEDSRQIWESLRDGLRRFIARRVSKEHDVEDVLQDVFCRIHARLSTLKDSGKLHAWVYQIARHAVVDYYRSHRVTVELPENLEDTRIQLPESPEASRDMASCLRPMIDDLPEIYRQALILTEFEGLTQKELGLRLGLSPSGAKSRVQRARGMLKKMLLACCQFEFDRSGQILDYQLKTNPCRYCTIDPYK
jgi:RNA polymerase sigma-70 factor (ECF subfamily)